MVGLTSDVGSQTGGGEQRSPSGSPPITCLKSTAVLADVRSVSDRWRSCVKCVLQRLTSCTKYGKVEKLSDLVVIIVYSVLACVRVCGQSFTGRMLAAARASQWPTDRLSQTLAANVVDYFVLLVNYLDTSAMNFCRRRCCCCCWCWYSLTTSRSFLLIIVIINASISFSVTGQ